MRTSRRGSPIGWHTYEYRPGGGRSGGGTRLGWIGPLCAGLALLLLVGGVAYAQIDREPPAGAADLTATRQTESGPVTAADEDLVKKVMTANYWEGELGLLAAERGRSEAVRTAGEALVSDHNGRLRDATVKSASQLRIPVPKRATEAQRKITERLARARGAEFDLLFANTLRNAHGVILPALANIRATTRNGLISDFAAVGMSIVARHMVLLEDTGLVDEDALDAPTQENVSKPLDPDDGGVGADPDDVEIPAGTGTD